MINFESENIPPSEKTEEDEKGNKEYKSSLTELHEQKANEERQKIKKLNEESKKLIEASENLIKDIEKKKKEADGLSS